MLLKRAPFVESLESLVYKLTGRGLADGIRVITSMDSVVRGAWRLLEYAAGRGKEPSFATVEEAMASFVVAAVVASRSGPLGKSRFIDSMVNYTFSGSDGSKLETVVLRAAGIKLEQTSLSIPWFTDGTKVYPKTLNYRVHVSDFLSVTAGNEVPDLRLANQFLLNGWVYVDAKRLSALARATARRLVESRLREAEALEDVPPEIERLSMAYRLALGSERLPYQREALPLCVRKVLESLEAGENPAPGEIYLTLTFLARLDTPSEVWRRLSDSLGIPRDQWKILQEEAQKWPLPSCRALSRAGICKCRGNLIETYKEKLTEAIVPA